LAHFKTRFRFKGMSRPNELKIVRELGLTESCYDFEVQQGALMISRTYLVSLDKKYDLNLAIVKQACAKWVQLHPFLRSYIHREEKSGHLFDPKSKKMYVEVNNPDYVQGLFNYFILFNFFLFE
jgi:hypothetical protein